MHFLSKSKIQLPIALLLIILFFALMENAQTLVNFQNQMLSNKDQPTYQINDDTFHGDLPAKVRYDESTTNGRFKKRDEEDADI